MKFLALSLFFSVFSTILTPNIIFSATSTPTYIYTKPSYATTTSSIPGVSTSTKVYKNITSTSSVSTSTYSVSVKTSTIYKQQTTQNQQNNQSFTSDNIDSASFRFNNNLSSGITLSPDIANLQILLNSAPATVVSISGIGSTNQPTSYFGTKTLDAVKRFQELYRSEILEPLGLDKPTGYVGESTRKKLNSLWSLMQHSNRSNSNMMNNSTSSRNTNVIYNTASSSGTSSYSNDAYTIEKKKYVPANSTGSTSYEPRQIFALSTYTANPKQEITIYGEGFHRTSNNVYLGNHFAGNYPSNKGDSEIKFTVPSTIPEGTYDVLITNEDGNIATLLLQVKVIKNAQ